MRRWIVPLLLFGRLVALELVAEPLHIEGAVAGERFNLVVEGSLGSRLEVWGVEADMKGVDLERFMLGEEARMVARSQSREAEAELLLVPHPMSAVENGYRLSLTAGESYTVRASGFEGEEKVIVVTQSEDVRKTFTLPLCKDCITFGFAPEGEFSIELQGEKGSVTLAGR